MARRVGRTKSRQELRRESEAAEKRTEAVEGAETLEAAEVVAAAPVAKTASTKRKAASPAVKKPARKKAVKKKAAPARVRIVWGIYDNSNNMIKSFPYAQRTMADQVAKELTDKGRGAFFVQPVKEAIAEPPPSDEAS